MWMPRRYLPVAVLVAGVSVASPACAAAQSYGYRDRYYNNADRRAYENGFREGREDGETDARRNRDFSYSRHDEYRDADDGYRRSDGDRGRYRQSFRRGFEDGYRNAYRGYAGSNGGYRDPRGFPSPRPGVVYGYRSPATDIGYRDGLEAGRDDARDGDSFDPVGSKRYRSADHEYSDRYGSKDDYKREYREAFQRGYQEGYRRF
jgi:hypothetical protein